MGTHWTDGPEAVAGCDNCLELAAEDLADHNDYQGRCLHCRRRSPPRAASHGAGWSDGHALTAGSGAGNAGIRQSPGA